jgi:hypothetical protein
MAFESIVFPENLKLYVARVDEHCPEICIRKIFLTVGRVNNVEFIQRKDYNNRNYKSAIITFHHWVQTQDSMKLFTDMNESLSGMAKFYYIDKRGQTKFLHVKEQPQEHVQLQSEIVHDIAKIKEIANESTSYACQIIYYRLRNKVLEKQAEELSTTQTIQRLQNDHLVYKLEEATREQEITNATLKIREMDLECTQREMIRMQEEINLLRRDVRDRNRIIDYYESVESLV